MEQKQFTLFGKGIWFWVLLTASILGNVVGNSAGMLVGRVYFVHGGSQRWLYTFLQSAAWPIFLPILAMATSCTNLISKLKDSPNPDEESHNTHSGFSHNHAQGHGEEDVAANDYKDPHALSLGSNRLSSNALSIEAPSSHRYQHRQKSMVLNFIISKWPKHSYKLTLFLTSTIIGLVLGADNLLFSWGLSYLPVSTNALIYSTVLAFNVIFSYILLGQKLSAYTVNSTVIVMTSAVLLGLNSSSDRPPGTTQAEYIFGFGANLAASVLYGLIMTLFELAYKLLELSGKAGTKRDMGMVLQVQVGSQVGAMVVSVIGMLSSGTFQKILEESRTFDIGVNNYIQTLVWSAVSWQMYTMGTLGIVFLSSSLMACVLITATLPLVPILAIPTFHDSFSSIKVVSTFLSIWGFVSYMYDRYIDSKK